MNGRPAAWRGVALLSLGVLLFELSLTRVLSVLFYYHTAFLAISVALLGLGAGALWVQLAPERFAGREGGLALAAAAGTWLLPAALPFLGAARADLDRFLGDGQLASLTLVVLLSLAPLICAGLVLASIFRNGVRRVGLLYGADLLGAATGTLLLIPAMEFLGGPGALLACGVPLGLAAWSLGARRLPAAAVLLLCCGLTLTQMGTGYLKIAVDLGDEGAPAAQRVLARKWNAFSRVVAVDDLAWDRGLSAQRMEQLGDGLAPQIGALIDINAFAPIVRFDGRLEAVRYLRDEVSNLALHVIPRGSRVGIIGPGGGKDVLGALLFEPSRVVGIEINPILVDDFVRGRFRDYSGNVYGDPRVTIHVGDGRSVLARLEEQFELIIANSVETWAAHSSGAMNLSEQALFTDRAFDCYMRRLSAGGILSISLWDEDEHAVPLRVIETMRAAHPQPSLLPGCVAVVANRWGPERSFTTVMIGKRLLTQEQVAKLASAVDQLGFEALYLPGAGHANAAAFENYFADPDRYLEDSAYDLSAATDDRPFLFYTWRLGDALRPWSPRSSAENVAFVSLVFSFLLLTVLAVLLIYTPLLVASRGTPGGTKQQLIWFSCLGAGFMLVETALLQRLSLVLGHPTYALTVGLGGLLLGTGLGSLEAARWAGEPAARRRCAGRLVMLLALLSVCWWGLPLLPGEAAATASQPLRVGVALVLVLLQGFFLGAPFPVSLTLLAGEPGIPVARAMAVNAACSVVASVLGVLIAVLAGFSAAYAAGLACYVLALATWCRPLPNAREG